MNRSYNYFLSHRLIVCTLLLGLCLQGCGSFSNSPISRIEGTSNVIQQSSEHFDVKQLIEQKLTAEEWELVSFYGEGDGLKVKAVEHNGSFSRAHDLVVRVAKDIDLKKVSRLSSEEQNRFVHMPGTKNGQPGCVIASGGGGLLGGMMEGDMQSSQPSYKKNDVQEKENKSILTEALGSIEGYQKAAEEGSAEAQYKLGVIYEEGKGIEKEAKQAFGWYYKAADQEYAEAQFKLGVCYESGEGVQIDYRKATECYQKATGQGKVVAEARLAYMYYNGYEIKADKVKANEMLQGISEKIEIGAELGDVDCQYMLGWMHEGGRGVDKDERKAVEWYQVAAEQEYENAKINLGRMYEKGDGVEKNKEKAVKWYRKAAEQENIDAQRKLKTLGVKRKN